MSTKRVEMVASELQKELCQILLRDLTDPRLGFVTITRVEPAPDLKSARVYISVIGDEKKQTESLNVLTHARNYIQNLVGDRMKLRDTPRLFFCYDKSIEKQLAISKLIEETIKEDEAKTKEPPINADKP